MPIKNRNSIGLGDRLRITLQALEEIQRMPKHTTATVEVKTILEHPDGSFELFVERVRGASGLSA